MSDCCHYDDAYEQGHDDAMNKVPEALEAVAAMLYPGDSQRADFALELASELRRTDLDRLAKRLRDRDEHLAELYREARAS